MTARVTVIAVVAAVAGLAGASSASAKYPTSYVAMADDRENSRVRDLVDLVILREYKMLETAKLASAIRGVWQARDGCEPPTRLSELPESWQPRYKRHASELDLDATTFPAAVMIVAALWAEMFSGRGG